MLPTPDYSHLSSKDFEDVYEPAEDTFILLDALEQDAHFLRERKPKICLEIGSGSGVVSAFVSSILGGSSALYLATDINQHASQCTLRTARQNKIQIDPLTAHLSDPFSPRLENQVDILIFNPPYVPTPKDEAITGQGTITGAWAGGQDGMSITDVLLSKVQTLLSNTGVFYLVAIKQNDVPAIQRRMLEHFSLNSEVVLQRRAGREHLFVIKFDKA
ncbi:PrmC-related family protein [Abortiporus biennis]